MILSIKEEQNIRIEDTQVLGEAQFYSADIVDEVIIGVNFLSDQGIKIDMEKRLRLIPIHKCHLCLVLITTTLDKY